MANENEKVLYEFQGDVSSLKKSTQDALSLLDKFQTTMDKLNSDGIVKASQRAQAGFNNSVNKMTKSVAAIQKKLNAVGDVRMPRGTEAFDATKLATDTLADTLDKLNSSNTITTKSLNELKTGLNAVTAGLKGAGPSFDAMVAKEEKFQQRLATIGTVANQFSSKLYGATDKVKNTFNSLGASIGAKFNAIGAKFDPLVTKLQSFKDRATIAGNRVSQVFATVAAAFRRTSDGTEEASRSQSKFGRVLDSIKERLSRHKTSLDETSSEYSEMADAADEAYSSMSTGASALTSSLRGVTGVVKGLVDSFFAFAGVELGSLFSDGAKSAIDYVENMNLFKVAMGSSIDRGNAFVAQMQEVYGMDPSNLHRYAGYFYQLTDAIGMSEEASATMSLSMTKAANDLASLFNEDINTVVDNLSSGMQGMSRAVRKYGMDIRTTTLQQTALKYGIEDEVETMSEANRQALRYITMLEQTQNALHQTAEAADGTSTEMGDFARNIESPANQLRIFKEQMSQLGRAIGNFIVAPLQKALPYINGFIMALRTVINLLASITGVAVESGDSLSGAGESAEDAASGVGAIGSAADKASKKLKQLIAPFDELNVLQKSSGDDSLSFDGTLDPALAKALEDMELNLENITMKANQVRDSILGFLGIEVTTDPITQEQIISWDKEAFMTNVMGSLDTFKAWFEDLSPIAQGAIIIAGVVTGLSVLGGIVSFVSTLLPILSGALSGISTAFGLLTSPIGLVIAALALLLTFSEEFRTQFVELFAQVGESFKEWGGILTEVFTTVGTDLVTMWDTHIKPTIEAIGDALAPALETLGSLWENLSTIVGGIFTLIGELWTNVLKPVIEGAMTIIQDLCEVFQVLWEEFVGPIVEQIGDSIERMWVNYLQPIISKIIGIVGDIIDILMVLWNSVFAPIVKFLADVLAPIFRTVFTAIWGVIEWAISLILNIIDTLLGVFKGITQFLAGVFTLDWKRALSGLLNIFGSLGNGLIGLIEGALNCCISLLNSFLSLVVGGVKGLINGLGDLIEGLAKFLGFKIDLSVNWNVPQIPKLSIPRIPTAALATGGVVTGPTHALIGEGKYTEAVIPLDDSPQMHDLIAKIADAVNKDDDNPTQPVEVKVYIGDKEYDAYTYKASERGKKIVGKQPVKIGG